MDEIIKIEILNTITNLFNFDDNIYINNMDSSLFLDPYNLKPYELLYLFYYLEEKFKISFKEEDIINYKFNTINNILLMFKPCLN